MRYTLIAIVVYGTLFSIAGCAITPPASNLPRHEYYEFIDKSPLLGANNDQIFMRWDRINTHCNAVVRQLADERSYRITPGQMHSTYNNCMASNNLRPISASSYRDVVNRNKEKYGKSFVIEKTWN